MDSTQIFWMQLLTSIVVFGIVAVWYVWPHLTKLSRNSALIPLLFVHVPRYVGMTLLVAGMVDPKLPREFRSSAAYGDLLEASLVFGPIFCTAGQLAYCRSARVGGQHVGIRGPSQRNTRPGPINTPIAGKMELTPEPMAGFGKMIARVPLGRPGKADEIAAAALHFASDASRFTTGTELHVDGGLTLV